MLLAACSAAGTADGGGAGSAPPAPSAAPAAAPRESRRPVPESLGSADTLPLREESDARRALYGQGDPIGGRGLARSAEAALQTAEALAAVELGPGDYPYDVLRTAWRIALAGEVALAADEGDADVEAARDSALASLSAVQTRAFGRLRRRMDTRAGRLGAYVVFNPLAWDRSGTVRVSLPSPDGAPATVERAVSLARVPALGAVAIPVGENGLPVVAAPTAPTAQFGGTWMENGYLRVEIDPRTGAITRLFNRIRGREALHPGGLANDLQPARPAGAGPGPRARARSISGSATPGLVTMRIEREWRGVVVRQELSLGRDSPFLDLVTEIEPPGEEVDLRIVIEPAAAPDSAAFGIPYGWSRRPDGTYSLDETVPERWIDVSEEEHGLSVLTDGRQRWHYRNGRLEMDYRAAARPVGAGVPGDRTPHSFRFALYPHDGDWREARTHLLSAEYTVPLQAAYEPRHGGPLGESFSLVRSDADNVSVAWVKRAEDDDDVLVIRLVEWFGVGSDTWVWVACPRVSARRANLREQPGEELPGAAGGFRVALRPREVATVRARCSN